MDWLNCWWSIVQCGIPETSALHCGKPRTHHSYSGLIYSGTLICTYLQYTYSKVVVGETSQKPEEGHRLQNLTTVQCYLHPSVEYIKLIKIEIFLTSCLGNINSSSFRMISSKFALVAFLLLLSFSSSNPVSKDKKVKGQIFTSFYILNLS